MFRTRRYGPFLTRGITTRTQCGEERHTEIRTMLSITYVQHTTAFLHCSCTIQLCLLNVMHQRECLWRVTFAVAYSTYGFDWPILNFATFPWCSHRWCYWKNRVNLLKVKLTGSEILSSHRSEIDLIPYLHAFSFFQFYENWKMEE